MNGHPITNPEVAKNFMLAGKATVTLKSLATGKHFTFKVERSKNNKGFRVALLRGPDNETAYTFLGLMSNDGHVEIRNTKMTNAPSARGFVWTMKHLIENQGIPEKLEIWHEGRCGRCGRKLTHPESLESGLGPICEAR